MTMLHNFVHGLKKYNYSSMYRIINSTTGNYWSVALIESSRFRISSTDKVRTILELQLAFLY